MILRLRVSALLAAVLVPAVAATTRAANPDPADQLAATIDRYLSADWKARGIKPAALADDAEFCRRVYLDIVGRTPKASEVRAFLDDTSAGKRAKLVDKLLTMPAHANYFAAVTRAAWLPQTTTNPFLAGSGIQLETWLRGQYRENTPADVLVRRLITVPVRVIRVNGNDMRFVQPSSNDRDNFALVAFYQANEGRPENMGAAVTRLFLGVKLECAQCHDHPFAPYTKEQFWEFAAFFANLNIASPLNGRQPNGTPAPAAPASKGAIANKLTIPNTTKEVTARFFDGTNPVWTEGKDPRQLLADWVTSPANAYFARNLANRMWAHFFGIGIIDPVDEPKEDNPPSHPELLAELGEAFAAAKFDNRLLIRAITRSQAYQLTSTMSHPTQANPRRFARMNVKGLTPAQLFDSLVVATGYREPAFQRANPNGFTPGGARGAFLARFSTSEKTTETNTTILQALLLMNGQFIGDQTDLERSEVLAAVLDMPGWDTNQRVEALFLTALARKPTPDEALKFGSYVDRGGATGDSRKALADVFWVLLNSPEFLFNH